jgi:Ca2+-transporting ATPase
VFAQLLHVLAIRSERESLFTLGLGSNLPLTLIVAGSILLQLAIIYTPLGNAWLNTRPLSAAELAIAFGAALIVFLGVEIEKALVRRGLLYGLPRSIP